MQRSGKLRENYFGLRHKTEHVHVPHHEHIQRRFGSSCGVIGKIERVHVTSIPKVIKERMPVASFTICSPELPHWRDYPKLLQHSNVVLVGPALSELPISNTVDVDADHAELFASGRHAHQFTLVRATEGETHHHFLSFAHYVLYGDIYIGNGHAKHGEELLGTLKTTGAGMINIVVREVTLHR